MKTRILLALGILSLTLRHLMLQDYTGSSIGFVLLLFILSDLFKKGRGLNDSEKKLQGFANGFNDMFEYARNLYSSSDTLKKVVTEEHEAVEKSSSALEEISSMLAKTADGAGKLATMALDAQGSVINGKNSVDSLLKGLHQINTSTDNLSIQIDTSLKELEAIIADLAEIKTKTTVIDDIVFQTKILSFNASVEAARAGDHGKGFAVVAEEMSTLAATSGKASHEINEILSSNLETTQAIILGIKANLTSLMKASQDDVKNALGNARSSADSLDAITKKVQSVTELSDEISSATKEQDLGVREITKAIHKLQSTSDLLNTVSQQTLISALSLSEQTQHQSRELLGLGKAMKLKVTLDSRPFDFDAAISAHLDWKMKLSRYMQNPDNSLDADKVCKDNACALGQWIYGEGQKFSHIKSHGDLRLAHAHFHKAAADIIRLINNGQLKEANRDLQPRGAYMVASESCVALIRELRSQVEENNAKAAS